MAIIPILARLPNFTALYNSLEYEHQTNAAIYRTVAEALSTFPGLLTIIASNVQHAVRAPLREAWTGNGATAVDERIGQDFAQVSVIADTFQRVDLPQLLNDLAGKIDDVWSELSGRVWYWSTDSLAIWAMMVGLPGWTDADIMNELADLMSPVYQAFDKVNAASISLMDVLNWTAERAH